MKTKQKIPMIIAKQHETKIENTTHKIFVE